MLKSRSKSKILIRNQRGNRRTELECTVIRSKSKTGVIHIQGIKVKVKVIQIRIVTREVQRNAWNARERPLRLLGTAVYAALRHGGRWQ